MLIKIGKIVNTKGLKGEVKVLSSSDFKDVRFETGNELYIRLMTGDIPVVVEKWRIQKGNDILTFRGYNNINEVEKFKGFDLYGEELDETFLGENEYYQEDLMGFRLVEDSEVVGTVVDVFDNVNRTYLRIELSDGQSRLIPFVDDFIKSVNEEKEEIEIISIPGLLDDEN